MQWADAMQEAYLVFMRCERKYTELKTPSQFMALFKLAWINQVNDLSRMDSKLRLCVSETQELEDGDQQPHELMGETDNAGFLAVLLREAPDDVRRILALMLTAPQELLDVVLAEWRGHDGRKSDGGGKRINAALGLPKDTDALALVHQYLSR